MKDSIDIDILYDRAFMLKKARDFFFDRKIHEVDCPVITKYASIDTHIDLMPVLYLENETRYLHSSPEYGMKRLLSLQCGDIYQLAHVFRNEGFGEKHNPEFMMAEWYRMGFSLEEMISETIEFVRLFIGNVDSVKLSYRETFQKYANIDSFDATKNDLLNYLKVHQIEAYTGIESESKDALLNLILGSVIEKQLGKNEIFILFHYPASQAALAKTIKNGEELLAERFEVYYKGIELANGYHELLSENEQRQRLIEANQERLSLKKNELPLDEHFLLALKNGIPECSGVAVGFDRLMMLRHNAKHIREVIPFDWSLS